MGEGDAEQRDGCDGDEGERGSGGAMTGDDVPEQADPAAKVATERSGNVMQARGLLLFGVRRRLDGGSSLRVVAIAHGLGGVCGRAREKLGRRGRVGCVYVGGGGVVFPRGACARSVISLWGA